MRVFDFDSAIVRLPGKSVVDGLRAGDHEGPSFDGVVAEHGGYIAALEAAGADVTVLPPLEQFPDAIFVEDPALVFTHGAILLRPGTPSRAAEAAELEPTLRQQFPAILSLSEGFADGGDVLVTPGMIYIGLSARTDEAGAHALIASLGELGLAACIAHTPPGTLHLKTASSLIDEETVLATAALANSGIFEKLRVLTVPDGEEGAANVLRINDRVLAAARYPRTLDLLDAHGLNIVPLKVSEVAKIDAGLTCMSLRWKSRQ